MIYQELSGSENFSSHREAIRGGMYDAISDVTKYTMIGLIAIIAYNAIPRKWVSAVKKEIKRVSQ